MQFFSFRPLLSDYLRRDLVYELYKSRQLGGTAQFLCDRAMEKDCTLKVERPVYEQEDLHSACGYAKPRSTGECHFLII